MDVGEAESEAISRATLLVSNMLQRPDQLQKVEQYKRRVQRKKLSGDAMLKTAMQSQLDGVRTGLSQFQMALSDLKEIKTGLMTIEDSLLRVPELSKQLHSCRDEYLKHSQYAAAMENLKHIFTVPDSIEKTKQFIAEGKLLNAHQCIMDLENSRDDLLYELHKLQNPNETRLLKEYFRDVQTLSDDLGKQLWIILQRTLNTVRMEPTQVVTALRIIEREERADQFALTRQRGSGFLSIGRPKMWRAKCFEVLENVVQQRIEGNQFEDRDTNKSWLIRHLEVIRLLLLEDFKVIRSQCVPRFPPPYDIMNAYVDMYHRNLAQHLIECVDGGLEDNEFVSLLSWVMNTYTGPDLMAHPSLGIDVSKLGRLLDQKVLKNLKDAYLENVKSNYVAWMEKALELEEKEWYADEPPPMDSESRYRTELPELLAEMVKQNLEVAFTISPEVQSEVLICSLAQVKMFASKYRTAITRYKDNYLTDRSKIPYFTTFMIALANSCQSLMDLMIGIKKQFWRQGSQTHVDKMVATHFEALTNTYQDLRDIVCDYLMVEALTDIQEQFNALLTVAWITDTEPMDTISLTINDYFQDYTHLHQKNFDHIAEIALNTVCLRYITAILSKKISLRSDEDRRKVGNRIIDDVDKLQSVFEAIGSEASKFDSPCEAIKSLAEVVKVTDMDFLSLEVHRLLRRYNDITAEHLTALLLLRGDIGRFEVRQRVTESMEESKAQRGGAPSPKSIFQHVQLPSSIFI